MIRDDFQKALEMLAARRQYLIEVKHCTQNDEEISALDKASQSLQKWLRDYESPNWQSIDKFILELQMQFRAEARFSNMYGVQFH